MAADMLISIYQTDNPKVVWNCFFSVSDDL